MIFFLSLFLYLYSSCWQTCSVESSISAASAESRKKFDASDPRAIHNLRYRLRTVEDFIEDTCTSAAAHNDKLENHGTQYPNYDCKSILFLLSI